ncbi:unnamed protein product [Prorocentrum cordatum]|uniref:Protein LTV1 homolog n=1 Tax=Prorocentrum cordatum TaxID=2364126 RepID=A0ABN9XEF8_9DINO|nr:unnamed protein product [Polarella glacialis]
MEPFQRRQRGRPRCLSARARALRQAGGPEADGPRRGGAVQHPGQPAGPGPRGLRPRPAGGRGREQRRGRVGRGWDDEGAERQDVLADMDGDCYFPSTVADNYDQHLKRVSGAGQGGGVAGVVMAAPKPKKGEKALFPDAKEIAIQKAVTDEEREVLEALENADEYEELDEEEVTNLLPSGAMCDLDEVLWGPTAKDYKDMPDLEAFKAQYAAMRGDLGGPGGEDFESFLAREAGSQCADRRPGAPAMNDAEFSEFLDREYADDEIGECEGADLDGPVDLGEHEEILDEYIQGKADEQERLISINEPHEPIKGKHEKDDGIRTLAETRAIIEKHYLGQEADEDETSLGSESPDESRTWDCESVLSILSNLSNRPGRIATIKVARNPVNPLKPVKEATDTAEGSDEGEEEDIVDLPDVSTTRPRNETAEERRERKAGVKELRRICRKMKKESKDTYKEASKAAAQPGSGDLRGKLRTFRLS